MKNSREKLEEICRHVSMGISRDDACSLVGIHRGTLYRWLKNATFATLFNQAELQNKQVHIIRLQNAGQKDWRASAYWLEHRYPEEFGKSAPSSRSEKPNFFTLFEGATAENKTNKLLGDFEKLPS